MNVTQTSVFVEGSIVRVLKNEIGDLYVGAEDIKRAMRIPQSEMNQGLELDEMHVEGITFLGIRALRWLSDRDGRGLYSYVTEVLEEAITENIQETERTELAMKVAHPTEPEPLRMQKELHIHPFSDMFPEPEPFGFSEVRVASYPAGGSWFHMEDVTTALIMVPEDVVDFVGENMTKRINNETYLNTSAVQALLFYQEGNIDQRKRRKHRKKMQEDLAKWRARDFQWQ